MRTRMSAPPQQRNAVGLNASVSAEPCCACAAPIRRAHVITEVTVLLDAVPNRRGSYFFDGPAGLVLEDPQGYVFGPKFRRHRCGEFAQDAA